MRLLELRHVDADQVPLAAVQQVRESQRGLGLAHAAGPDQHEDADRLARIVQAGTRRDDALRDGRHGLVLPDHAPLQHLVEAAARWRSRPSPSCRAGCRSSRRSPRRPPGHRPQHASAVHRPATTSNSSSSVASCSSEAGAVPFFTSPPGCLQRLPDAHGCD